MGSVLHRRIVFDFHCNNKHISAEIQIGGVCRLSTASSERISHAEVERRVVPLEVVDPPLAGRIVGIVQLNTPVQAQHGELDVEPDAEASVESQLFVEVADVEDASDGYSSALFPMNQMFPTSKKVAPWKIPQIGKRNSRFASSFMSPSWTG